MTETSHSKLVSTIATMQTFGQDCLQGILDCELQFQAFTVSNPSPEDFEKQYQKTLKSAMINTYAFLYIQNLLDETKMDLKVGGMEAEKEGKEEGKEQKAVANK